MYDEKYQHDYPNSHYLANLNNLNRTNQSITLNRLPTLGEILANRTKLPVDLYTFYLFMKGVEHKVDYVDFWFDLINHLNLCKHYVQGLRDSIARHSSVNETGSHYRNSVPLLERSKHKSLSSSILLDLIANDNILEDSDSHRLSQFLRGDINVDNLEPKLRDMINQYNEENDERRHSAGVPKTPTSFKSKNETSFSKPPSIQEAKRLSSNSKLLDDMSFDDSSLIENQLDIGQASKAVNPRYKPLDLSPEIKDQKRVSSINPSLLEKLIKHTPGSSEHQSFITRNNLKESSHNLLLKYFVTDSEKDLDLPEGLKTQIINAIEVDGRDDPDVFNNVKLYIFSKIEHDHLPRFLNFMAIRNVNHSNSVRVILGFFFSLIGFWVGFIFVFLNYRKSLRPVIIIPFLLGFYFLVSSIYLIDPILAWFGYSESFINHRSLIRIREPFIYKLLLKRSLWVVFLIFLFTAIFTIIFSLVPGRRL
ncbi:uncharacterized protein PRCAT00000747001 [Priceomyces carsonii]|uniref:uncharacterized protein n=1 Tax=Priceomyces carsonii TaxID=28549 RepID=UPI002ED9D305|nr:unnamed protein product [Priceomyces carsonii]